MNDYSNLKILLVDDDEPLTMLYEMELSEIFSNSHIDIAYNGKDALNLYKKNNYDLIITDNKMPEMNGVDLARAIRKNDLELPIFLVTGLIKHVDKEKSSPLFQGILEKPLNFDSLKLSLSEIGLFKL